MNYRCDSNEDENTWKTVSKLCQNESKLWRGKPLSKLNLPPKTCMPSREKITMKRNSSNNREAIDWIELSRDATKLDRERQYLPTTHSSSVHQLIHQHINLYIRDHYSSCNVRRLLRLVTSLAIQSLDFGQSNERQLLLLGQLFFFTY